MPLPFGMSVHGMDLTKLLEINSHTHQLNLFFCTATVGMSIQIIS